jgi:cell division protein FtsL
MTTRTQVVPAREPVNFLERHTRTILGVAIVALALHDIFGAHGFLAMRRAQNQIGELRVEIQRLDTENQTLSQQIDRLKTDPRMIEKIARDEMNLQRPGEHVFKLPQPPEPSKPGSPRKPATN